MRYCEYCERYVKPVKKWSWFWFLFGLLFFGIGAVVYILWYWLFAGKKCPICGGEKLTRKWFHERKLKKEQMVFK